MPHLPPQSQNATGRTRSARSTRRTTAEVLESRRLLSASPGDPAALEARGFERIEWNGEQAYAMPGRWILDVDERTLASRGKKQLDELNGSLKKVRQDVKATKLLGKDGLVLLETPRGARHQELKDQLKGLRGFEQLEPDFAVWADATASDPYYASHQWALNNTGQTGGTPGVDIDAQTAWDVTRGNGSVVVGVIDSGVDYGHADLAAAVWRNPGERAGDGIDNDGNGYVDDVHGWDFANRDSQPLDDHGHGTHVAGTIAAAANNGAGVAGVANAKVMALKFLAADGAGYTSDAIAAVNYATTMRRDHGVNVRVTNNSWSGGGFSQVLQDAISAHDSAGIMFVAAAGNGGGDGIGDNNNVFPTYPAGYDLANVISVAATDHRDGLASFSNYGSRTVDLGAPGVNILSTYPGGGWGMSSGTSMAAPHVAGVAALAWNIRPAATVANVRDALLGGVERVRSLSKKTVSGGRLNARRTLDRIASTVPAPAPAAPSTPSAGGPYVIAEGQTLTLVRSEATDANGDTLTYSWDVNGDGTFGDESHGTIEGDSLTLTWSQLAPLGITDGPTSRSVSVRVDDGTGHVVTSSPAALTVNDAPPAIELGGAGTVESGAPYVLTLGPVTDPGSDTVSGYVVNWGDGAAEAYTAAAMDQAGRQLTHTYTAPEGGSVARTITVDVTDEDGAHAAVASKGVAVAAADAGIANLALNKTATQSSVGWDGEAARAVDGNTDGDFANGSVSHTGYDANAWWEVDLGAVHELGDVQIYNRTDYGSERLSDFYVLVSDVPFASTGLDAARGEPGVWSFHTAGPVGAAITIPVDRSGRYVRVQLAGTNYLTMAEVKVLPGKANLAINKAATQSSVGWGGEAARAVDGNTNGDFAAGSVSHTDYDASAWWEVDLGSVQAVGELDIYNRTDYGSERLSNFYVLVSDVPFTSTDLDATRSQAGVSSFHVDGPVGAATTLAVNRTARYVRVQLAGTDYLSLAEVKVFSL